MEHKTAIFGNKGMSQDSSISKSSNELVYENKNIRITAREDGTLLSVTNEKFPSEKQGDNFYTKLGGTFYGSLALPNKVVLFSQFDDLSFIDVCEYNSTDGWIITQLINSESSEAINLNFSAPIEATFYYERDDIQKVYWVDGVNNLRVINIAADALERATWDDSSFDCVPTVDNIPSVTIEKQYGGSGMFPSGVIQYFFSYFKKHGQESKIVQTSDLNYISFQDRGAKPDETVNCNFKITLSNLDTSFDYVRVYSAKRTALDGSLDVHIVADVPVSSGSVEVIDTNINQPVIDSSLLYFIGGDAFKASTIEQKDNTLFLGNIETDIPVLTKIQKDAVLDFFNSYPIVSSNKVISDEPKTLDYTYIQQNLKSSSKIKGFKSGEWYRIGIQFQDIKGQWTDPLWIQDINVNAYPHVNNNGIDIPSLYWGEYGTSVSEISEIANDDKLQTYRFVMVEPTNNTRKIVAQGVVNPTVFNLQERCEGTINSITSWISRPFNSSVHHAHMESLGPNNETVCEIQNIQTALKPIKDSNTDSLSNILLLYVVGSVGTAYLCNSTTKTVSDLLQDYSNEQVLIINTDYTEEDMHVFSGIDYNSAYKDLQKWLKTLGCDINDFISKGQFKDVWNNFSGTNEGKINDVDGNAFFSSYNNAFRFWLKDASHTYPNQEQFYVDTSIVTLNSPEIEYGNLQSLDSLRFRLIGCIPVSSYYRDYIAEFDNYAAGSDAYLESIEQISNSPIISDYLLYDYKIDPDETSVGGFTYQMIYPFQKQNSAIGQMHLNINQASLYTSLKHKVFANYLYSNKTCYFMSSINYVPNNLVLSSETLSLLANGNKYHSSNYEKLVTSKNKYSIWYKDGSNSDIEQVDPVHIKTKQTPHAIVELEDRGNDGFEILPGLVGYNVAKYFDGAGDILRDSKDIYEHWTIADAVFPEDGGRDYFWDNQHYYMHRYKYCAVTPTFSYNNSITANDEFLFVGEIYKNVNSAIDLYGSTAEENLKKYKWIPISKIHLIADNEAEIYPSEFEGDTYFQRWECLRTYPATEDDENSVVDIVSFMVETHINLDGRDDINRGPFNLTTKRPTNTNLMNSVYSQMNNIFHYNIVDLNAQDGHVVDKFANQITWSLAKSPVMEVDPWTNINLANVQNAKGEYGPINEITKLGDTLILFQDRAIATIDYNNRTQISTEQGVPIELANSGKVNGISYVSTLYGCKNKHSIISTKTGIYFIDDINKAFINISKEGVKDISTSAGMSLWFANKLASQSYWDGGQLSTGFVCKYDQKFGDIYIMNNNTCLVYNELLQTFVSLFDEYRYTDMFTFNSGFFYIKPIVEDNADYFVLGKMFSGDYSDDYYITYKINPEPYSDKIFTNVELIADKFTANANIDAESPAKVRDLPFNKLRAWNEYQDTGETTIAEKPYDASNYKDKFRIRHIQLPRASDNNSKYKLDRLRNPWIFLRLENNAVSGNKLVYHSMITHYYE